MRNNNVTIHGINDTIAYCEAIGLGKVFTAYAENASRESIEAVGFNPNSGYVYIALENGVSICSMLGHAVEYLLTNPCNGDAVFYDSYADAIAHEWEEDLED